MYKTFIRYQIAQQTCLQSQDNGSYSTATWNWKLNKSGDKCFEGEDAVLNINSVRDCLYPLSTPPNDNVVWDYLKKKKEKFNVMKLSHNHLE